MKFWQKIFLSTLLIFILIFDTGVLVLVSYSYNFSLQREIDSGVREQGVILSSVYNSISSAEKIFNGASQNRERLIAVIEPLAEYYINQGVFLAIYCKDALIYSNAPEIDQELISIGENDVKNVATRRIGDYKYLFAASRVQEYPHLTFVYVRDISQIDAYRTNISRVFIAVNGVVCVVLGITLYILLKRLTSPINKLNITTSEIANGAYDKRVNIKRKDELGELGETFNAMADSIEENIRLLKKEAEDRQQLIDNLAHEMKTPLTAILGYSEYLQKAMSNEEDRMKAASHLHDAADRLKLLSGKLLDLTYLRNEKIECKEIKVEALFLALSNIMKPTFIEKKLKIDTIVKIETISGDEALLLSLLINLVENAARASSESDIITIRAYKENTPIIEIRDTGCGIKKEEITKIMNPFYCVDKSRSRNFGGVGLGLSIVSQIAYLHGAELKIDSEPNYGTNVKIIFNNSIATK